MPLKNPAKQARKALATLKKDREERLLKIDRYERGDQDEPYTPDYADEEYRQLAERSITNVIPFLLGTPSQMMYVDSFRRGKASAQAEVDTDSVQPEWDHWQKSRLDARQAPLYRGALKFGHAFTSTLKYGDKGVLTKTHSPLKTVALYDDPANDEAPELALTITRWANLKDEVIGLATMWDDTYEYPVTFKSLDDPESVKVGAGRRHGASTCPVTRFVAAVDLEGRTCGVVEPMFRIQDRINQTVFDLLIVQTFASFKVRTITGLAPPIKMKAIDSDGNTVNDPDARPDDVESWVPLLDARGKPIPDEVNISARRALWAEDADVKFGQLDETPLEGFIAAIEMGFRHMAALSQTPPHHILGEISNLSAEALEAAESALSRKVDEFKASFGESWERVFRIAAEIGEYEGADDFHGEVIWRDQSNASLAQSADALGKFAEALEIPRRGLWNRIPNVTANELSLWDQLHKEETPARALAETTTRAGTSGRPSFRLNQADQAQPAA